MKTFLFALASLLLVACSSKPEQPAPASQTPPPETVVKTGVLTYSMGTVEMGTGSQWTAIDIGDTVPVDSKVRTGVGSSCDIQFAKLGIVHLSEKTEISLNTIGVSTQRKAVDLELLTGSVTAKVSKLLGKDRFEIKTDTVVCAVRGTRFVVTQTPGIKTTIGVAEGSVGLLPPTYNAEKFELQSASPEQTALVDAVKTTILQSTTTIEVGSQVEVTRASLQKPAEAMERIQASLDQVTAASQSAASQSLPTDVSLAVENYKKAFLSDEAPKPAAITPQVKKTLDQTVDLKIEDAPPVKAPESAPQPAQPAAPAAVPATTPAPNPTPAAPPAKPVKVNPVSVLPLGTEPLASLQASGKTLLAYEKKGTVTAFKLGSSSPLWTLKTGKTSSGLGRPRIAGTGAFASDSELVGFEPASGKSLFRVPLTSAESGALGRRPLLAGDLLYLTSDSGLLVFDAKAGARNSVIALSGPADSTPALLDGKIHLVGRDGTYFVVDPATQNVAKFPTDLKQPVASAIAFGDGKAVAVDRKGTVICLDPSDPSKPALWEKKLDASKSVPVFSDPVILEKTVFFLSRNTLYALSLDTGDPIGVPLANVAGLPVEASGLGWTGLTDGTVVGFEIATGTVQVKLNGTKKIGGDPLGMGKTVLFPADGSVVVIDTDAALVP